VRWRILIAVLTAAAGLLVGPLTASASAQMLTTRRDGVAAEPLYAFNTGQVLTASQNGGHGTLVRVAPDAGGTSQRWVLAADGRLSPASNHKLCLNVPKAAYKAGTKLELWTCNGSASERFAVSAPSAHTPVFHLTATADRKFCVSTQTTITLYNTQFLTKNVLLSRCNGAQSQAWSASNLASVVGQFAFNYHHDLVAPNNGAPGGQASLVPVGNGIDEEWEVKANGAQWSFSPIADTATCLTIAGKARLHADLFLTPCTGSAAQSFVTIDLRFTGTISYYLFAAADAKYCLAMGKAAKPPKLPLVLAGCPNTGSSTAGMWMSEDTTSIASQDLDPQTTGKFQEFWADPQVLSNEYGMIENGSASGTAVRLASTPNGIAQVWTDITPGSLAAGNPDGSISIRPLNDLNLCLTVPAANYQAGVVLQVQTCNGESDQEFATAISTVVGQSSLATVRPYSAQSLCISPEAGVVAGSLVDLQACGGQADTWGGWNPWFSWLTPA